MGEMIQDERNDLRTRIKELEGQVDCAKVSLDKFFDSEYSGDLCNMAVDAREIFCKVGDMLDKAEAERDRYRDALEYMANYDTLGTVKTLVVLEFRKVARTALKEK